MKTGILILILGFYVNPAVGFTLNSSTNPDLSGWADSDIKLLVNTANCPAGIDVPGIIAEAVEVWNNVPTSSMKVSYGGATTSTTFASPATVYCETNFQSVLGANQDYVPGAAAVQAPNGQITSGILYLNASSGLANISNFDRTVLTIVLAHEIGHILGLGHSESTNALMYFDASAKTEPRLSQDDMDGISYLYPSNELSDHKIAGCGLVDSSLPPPSTGTLTFLFSLLFMPLVLCWGWAQSMRRNLYWCKTK
ncbi:MAG: hypothetical protein COT73_07575 [Bdellovibrio sp. CG10_big_fil_rev_8_21_14_0_10_47_8]|nr:MAG: hypothetical protein COT73_07575 [Bdellovibrio sp. CG10_big_fil_rev_8_21_14_0_10_47_8]